MNVYYKLIFNIIGIIIVTYVIYGLYLFLFQERFVFHPDKQSFEDCPEFADSQKINMDGTRFYYKENNDKLVVFYHGNMGSACGRSYFKEKLEEWGFSYIFVEYTGYSNDKVKPTNKRVIEDVKRVSDFISKKNFSEVILIGESLGSGPVSYQTTLLKIDKVILIAPFHSLHDIARRMFPFYPTKLMITNDFVNYIWLKTFSGRVLIIQGQNDREINPKSSKRLFESIQGSNKEYKLLPGVGHNDIYGYDGIWDLISKHLS